MRESPLVAAGLWLGVNSFTVAAAAGVTGVTVGLAGSPVKSIRRHSLRLRQKEAPDVGA